MVILFVSKSYLCDTKWSCSLPPLRDLIDHMLPVPGHCDGVLDNPGVAVPVAHVERFGVFAHGYRSRLAIVAEKN